MRASLSTISYDAVQHFDDELELHMPLNSPKKMLSNRERSSGNHVSFANLSSNTPSKISIEFFKVLVGLGGKASAEETAKALLFSESQKRLLKRAVDLGDAASAEELASTLKLGWNTTASEDLFAADMSPVGQTTTGQSSAQMVALKKMLGISTSAMLTSISAAMEKLKTGVMARTSPTGPPAVAPKGIIKSQSQPLFRFNETTDVEEFVGIHSEDEDLAYRPKKRVSTPIPNNVRTWRKGAGVDRT